MRTIIITGASRGIGHKIALKALDCGHRLSLGLRNLDSIKGTRLDPDISGHKRIILNHYDALDNNSIIPFIKNTIKKFNSLDTLILCAGIFKKTKLLFKESEISEINELWQVNVMSPWLLSKESWKYLIKSKKGRIQVLVSMSGKRSKGNLAGYSVSKFALMGLCQTLRNEGWDNGIRVTAICPGWVNTDMSKDIKVIDKKDMTQSEDIAELSSTLLKLPNGSIPFEISLNCNLEK